LLQRSKLQAPGSSGACLLRCSKLLAPELLRSLLVALQQAPSSEKLRSLLQHYSKLRATSSGALRSSQLACVATSSGAFRSSQLACVATSSGARSLLQQAPSNKLWSLRCSKLQSSPKLEAC